LRMTKVIKGEFEKLEELKVEDVSLTCDTSLEVFNNEFNHMSRMDDDLFTYDVQVPNIPCDSNKDNDSEQRMSHENDDDMGYDPSDVVFTEWLGSKFFNYKTMDHYTKKALWIYWIRGDDEVELTDEEFFNDEDEVAEVLGSTLIYLTLRRLYLEWYEALEDSELKDVALRNKAIMEGLISDDESCNDCRRRGKSHEINYHDYDEREYRNETHDERHELYGDETHEVPVCLIRRYKMIKYSFNDDEEYVAVKEDEYDDLKSQDKRRAELTKKSFA
ncbi:hypothetical protein Tco_1364264, partial [Tanacetum coccineum]